jgi:hypothetical protein
LINLRQSRSWRRELENLLSPRHIHLDPWHAPAILRRLERKGLIAIQDLERVISQADRSFDPTILQLPGGLSKAERAYCLSLLLMGEGF